MDMKLIQVVGAFSPAEEARLRAAAEKYAHFTGMPAEYFIKNRLVLQSEHLLPQGAQEPPADVVWPADAPNKNLPEAQAH